MEIQITFLLIIVVMQFFIICWMYNKLRKIGTVVGVNYLNIQQLCTQMNKVEKKICDEIEIKIDIPGENK